MRNYLFGVDKGVKQVSKRNDWTGADGTQIHERKEDVVKDKEHLYFLHKQGQRCRLPPNVSFGNGRIAGTECVENKQKKIIFWCCYVPEHISLQCPVKLYELEKLVFKYEG